MAIEGPFALNGLCALRVARNVADGTPDYGNPKGALMLCGGIQRFVYDFDTQAGKATLDEDACGTIVVNRRRDDQVLRVNWTLTLLRSVLEFDDVVGAAQLVTSGGNVIGSIVNAASGCAPQVQPSFSMELWSEQVDCSDLADPPYRLNLMGKCKLTPKGHTKEDATATVTYQGFGYTNKNFGDGPFGQYPSLVNETDWCWGDFFTDSIPDCPDPLDYIALPANS